MSDSTPRYHPPKSGTRGTWDEPVPAGAKDNFKDFPVLPHQTVIDTEPVTTVDPAPVVADPIPVVITNPVLPARDLKRFSTQQYSILGGLGRAQQIASRRPNRTKLVIVNMTAGKTVYVGDTADTSDVHDGFPLAPGTGPSDGISMEHQQEVYVYNPDASNTVVLALYSEYVTEIQ